MIFCLMMIVVFIVLTGKKTNSGSLKEILIRIIHI